MGAWVTRAAQNMSLGLGESEIVPIFFSQCDVESVHGEVEGAMGAGTSGEEAYRLLVSQLRRELDTRVCGAALQKLIAFRVGEGAPFSDYYRSFRTVVHDAKSDRQFAANFNIVQSIVSVLMSQ